MSIYGSFERSAWARFAHRGSGGGDTSTPSWAQRCSDFGGTRKDGQPCGRLVSNSSPYGLCHWHRDPTMVARYRREWRRDRLETWRERLLTALTRREADLAAGAVFDAKARRRSERRVVKLRRDLADVLAKLEALRADEAAELERALFGAEAPMPVEPGEL